MTTTRAFCFQIISFIKLNFSFREIDFFRIIFPFRIFHPLRLTPATQQVVCMVPQSTAAELKQAEKGAYEAFKLWKDVPIQQRQVSTYVHACLSTCVRGLLYVRVSILVSPSSVFLPLSSVDFFPLFPTIFLIFTPLVSRLLLSPPSLSSPFPPTLPLILSSVFSSSCSLFPPSSSHHQFHLLSLSHPLESIF